MSEPQQPEVLPFAHHDELARLAHSIETAVANHDFQQVVDLTEPDPASVWFAIDPLRCFEILQLLNDHGFADSPVLRAGMHFIKTRDAFGTEAAHQPTPVSDDTRREVLEPPQATRALQMLQMFDLRSRGKVRDALEIGTALEQRLGHMSALMDATNGLALHVAVQVGITAMLAGDFTRALTCFTRAQMHPVIPKLAFLSRDALVKAALIHACFGNATTAASLIQRSRQIPRTSSWAEDHIDAHETFIQVLLNTADRDAAAQTLESISLHDVGEMWPFYIFAMHRIFEAAEYHDELAHRIEMFDAMPFPRFDGDGFMGSILPIKHALLALQSGKIAVAQTFLDRADHNMAYTQLIQAASHTYGGRPQQAIQVALRIRTITRGFRSLETLRMAILAAAQYLDRRTADCVDTLTRATELPRGLTPAEAQLFSPETRKLAEEHVTDWPAEDLGPSVFLTGLPAPSHYLTQSEIDVIGQLSQGLSRAKIAEAMFISINTVKTHLTSIYRKLEVSTAEDAIRGAQRRGLL